MAVYGYGENKCKNEVYTKNDYLIIDGNVSIGSTATDGVYSGTKYLDVSDDLTLTNWVVISMQYGTSIPNTTPSRTTSISCSMANQGNGNLMRVEIKTESSTNAGKKLAVRVVLMKVE